MTVQMNKNYEQPSAYMITKHLTAPSFQMSYDAIQRQP